MKISVMITGATGMVGEGVLLECLDHPDVGRVLVINRRPLGRAHPKLKEIVHADFFDLSPIQSQLAGYDACFFCLGVSSVGMKKEDYRHTTYDLTLNVARLLASLNPSLVFCYVSGKSTDANGKMNWARVKGETENALLHLFPRAHMFRPGFMKTVPGQRNANKYYPYFAWIYPIGRKFFPGSFCTLTEVGKAMINTVTKGGKAILEVKDIVDLARSG